jgi:hypothetical protein
MFSTQHQRLLRPVHQEIFNLFGDDAVALRAGYKNLFVLIATRIHSKKVLHFVEKSRV